jgi:predicted transcriptional regulator
MKKFTLFFIFFYFFFNIEGNAFSAELSTKKKLTRKEITNEWLKNKTVTNLKLLGFVYRLEFNTTTEDSVQYYLSKSTESGSVRVICFVDPKKTICRLP